MPTAPTSRRRTRRTVEFGGWVDRKSWKGPGTPLPGNGSLILRRRKERSLSGGRKVSYLGIDARAEPGRSVLKSEKGRQRVVVEWRKGSYDNPALVRPHSVDDIHMHMINDSSLTPQKIPGLIQSMHRMLRPGGRIYFTADNKMIGDTNQKRMIYLHQMLSQFYRSRLFRARYLSISPNSIPEGALPPAHGRTAPRLTYAGYWFNVRGFRPFRKPAGVEAKLTQFDGNVEVMAILTKRKRPSAP